MALELILLEHTWKSIKLQFTATGYAMYVNNVLAFNQSSTNVTIAGPLTDFSNVINFLQNASTLMFGTGSWWSDNTDTNGAYFDFQSTYLKNIKFTPDFSSATAINQPTVDAKSELVGEEYLGISGVKVGKEYSKLLPGIYIKKSLYNDGSTKSEKIFKVQ